MQDIITLIAPIFLIILLGKILRFTVISDDFIWGHINRLSYWVLFPCLLFNKTSVIDFADFAIGPLSFVLITGFSITVSLTFVMGKLYGLSPPSLTSVIQGGARHNAFIALAIVSQLFIEQGAMIGAIIIAILVTFTNIVVISIMTTLLSEQGISKAKIFSELKRNPIILSIGVGLFFNYMGWAHMPVIHDVTFNMGQTTLPIALLCVGAGLTINNISDNFMAVFITCISKLVIFPVSIYVLARLAELPHMVVVAAVIFAISPAGTVSYPLAKQMGGDAPLMATIISLQTLLSIFAIPMVIYLLQ